MTVTDEPQRERSLLAQIFISPDEPRLRAGWRVVIYLLVSFVFLFVVMIPLSLIILILDQAGIIQMDVPTTSNEIGIKTWFDALTYFALALSFTLSTWLVRRFIDRRSFSSLG